MKKLLHFLYVGYINSGTWLILAALLAGTLALSFDAPPSDQTFPMEIVP